MSQQADDYTIEHQEEMQNYEYPLEIEDQQEDRMHREMQFEKRKKGLD